MLNFNLKKIFLFISLFFSISIAFSQNRTNSMGKDFTLIAGNSLRYSSSVQYDGNAYKDGIGLYTDFDFKLVKGFSIRGDFGWNEFLADNNIEPNNDHNNLTDWEFSGGIKYEFAFLYIEGLAGYRTGFQTNTYSAGGGVLIKNFSLGANYNIIDDQNMMSYKLVFYW